MARVSKYEGGSKAKSFRLPAKFFTKAVKEVESLLSKYEKKPLAIVFSQTREGDYIGGVDPYILSGKEYYDLNMANIPSEKAKKLFLAATPSAEQSDKNFAEFSDRMALELMYPEKRIPGTLKKEAEKRLSTAFEADPKNITISKELKKKLQELDPNIIIPGDKKNKNNE
jgi:hypothetical protein